MHRLEDTECLNIQKSIELIYLKGYLMFNLMHSLEEVLQFTIIDRTMQHVVVRDLLKIIMEKCN